MGSKYKDVEMEDDEGGLIAFAKRAILDTILKPVRIVLSRTALRAYLTTALVIFAALVLLGFAIAAYILFYWSYIPRIGFERTIHLQFDNVFYPADPRHGSQSQANPYPYGSVSLAPDVVGNQRYDVAIEMTLPRTVENMDAGNFMLEVTLLGPGDRQAAAGGVLDAVRDGMLPIAQADGADVLARSRRPGILPYRTWMVELAYKLTELHWYLLGLRQEAERLRVDVFEGIAFGKGRRQVPASLRVEVQSTHRMQFYGAKALFRARFSGLRWLMYNYRMLSAAVFVGAFWVTELVFAGLAWAVLVVVLNPAQKAKAVEMHEVAERVKEESPEEEKPVLSETERIFPTVGGQMPLRYQSPEVKLEEAPPALQAVPPVGLEADDEDEDADFFADSGLGTSMESSAGRPGSMRKRRGRLSMREG